MALVGKPGCQRDLRKRKVGLGKKILRSLHPALDEIFVRGHAFRLLECTGEVIHRKPGNAGERLDADILLQVRLNELADASQRSRRQAAPNTRAQLDDGRGSKIVRGNKMPRHWLPLVRGAG